MSKKLHSENPFSYNKEKGFLHFYIKAVKNFFLSIDKVIKNQYNFMVLEKEKTMYNRYIKISLRGGNIKWHNQKEDGQKQEQV